MRSKNGERQILQTWIPGIALAQRTDCLCNRKQFQAGFSRGECPVLMYLLGVIVMISTSVFAFYYE